jgi:EAL domain-containing protein (putative c-di-GMP-specific phosphodiesterase class I)
MLPKKGKRFPNRDGKGSAGLSYPRAIAAALRGELGDTHQAIKIVMRWTGAGERREDFARGLSILRRLKALGVRIAMDDFGTGYSSLSYLQAFPFDKIKIDQSFISNLKSNPQSAAIVCAVVGLARGLNLPVLAEGVETNAQLDFLATESCDEVQGYLIGRPHPIAEYSKLIGRLDAMDEKLRRT